MAEKLGRMAVREVGIAAVMEGTVNVPALDWHVGSRLEGPATVMLANIDARADVADAAGDGFSPSVTTLAAFEKMV